MSRLFLASLAALAAALTCLAGPAAARQLAFTATLDGQHAPTDTGSDATGQARIVVDTDTRTVDLTLDVQGIAIDELWSRLAASPMGPIHLHRYGSHDRSEAASVALVLPVPMGPAYSPTPHGFHVAMQAYPYAAGAALLKSGVSFDDFLASMQGGQVVLNIHTNAEHDGEISGEVVPAG
ncbi:CHRD domain-containing protein [Caulobacter sp. KR2-114]|uniref:CHRD domain-containing protein n=1 Tax=Caulobacter sp. KR2-114 TaxID=3400912 RepID=UPI003BFF02F7